MEVTGMYEDKYDSDKEKYWICPHCKQYESYIKCTSDASSRCPICGCYETSAKKYMVITVKEAIQHRKKQAFIRK